MPEPRGDASMRREYLVAAVALGAAAILAFLR
jgi:hypothetical protein